MKLYVDNTSFVNGNGSKARPFKHISDAAKIAQATRYGFLSYRH